MPKIGIGYYIFKLLSYPFTLKQVIAAYIVQFGLRKCVSWILSIKKGRIAKSIDLESFKYLKNHIKKIKSIQVSPTLLGQQQIDAILNASVTQLKVMLKQDLVSSEDLVNIFTSRAITIGLNLCIVTEINYKEAIQLAKQCDIMRKQDPSILDSKPLFGIPISIKDSIDLKGYASTLGVFRRTKEIKEMEGLVMHLIRESGAIPFIRTNIPQFTMSYESSNKLFGRVLNPWDLRKMAGGSSGGEAAAIASRVSPIGIGTDIGGSIRTPAAFTGIFGFKPTVGRIPHQGTTYYSPILAGKTIVKVYNLNQLNIAYNFFGGKSISGPLGKCVEDLALMMRALTNVQYIKSLAPSKQDIYEVIMPFKEDIYNDNVRKPRIGYFKTLEYFDATLSNQRGVQEAADILQAAGYEVKEIDFPFGKEILKHFCIHVQSDQLEGYRDIIGDEENEFLNIERNSRLSPFQRSLIVRVLRLLKEERLADTCEWSYALTASEYLRNCDAIIKLREKVIELFEFHQIEAIISPSFAHPAVDHNMFKDSTINSIYNLLWNVINLPCGVMPITRVRKDEQHYQNSRINDRFSKILDNRMKSHTEGLPVGVQVATLPFQDELCLNIMKKIDDASRFYQHNSFPL